jgi:N6-L-threonylcarbamoyladenine synthase
MTSEQLTLGIETSCDETAAAVYSSTRGILSNKLFSQVELHKQFGGVVPEVASRSHLEKINIIIQEALAAAQTTLEAIDTVAVTSKPGLPGSLLIGLCFAKALAATHNKKLIGINHLEGHAFSSFLDAAPPFPHLCITASGGHTSLYLVRGFGDYDVLGQTVDDAAGEAFDKIAKLLNLPYPGGPVIEKLATEVNFEDFYHYSRKSGKGLDFSFSGLKTAVLYDLVEQGMCDLSTKKFHESAPQASEIKKRVASSLLVCITDIFKQKIEAALKLHSNVKAVTFVGGVACNKFMKRQLADFCQERGLEFFSPAPQYCTDNAAMIALVGNYKAEQGKFSDLKLDILDY